MRLIDRDLSVRSSELEKMDSKEPSYFELRSCLKDIAYLNRWTGAYSGALRFVEKCYDSRLDFSRPLTVLDVGFGSGELLAKLDDFGQKRGMDLSLSGIELSSKSVKVAKEFFGKKSVKYCWGDFLLSEHKYDVILGNLVLHHMKEDEAKLFVERLCLNSNIGWYLHDLHRHAIPYFVTKEWVEMADLDPMVKFDAPLSVARGFKSNELETLFNSSNTQGFKVDVQWKFPFKYQITGRKEFLQ